MARSLAEYARRRRASRILAILCEANYDLSRIDAVIDRAIASRERYIEELESMTNEEFYARVRESRNPFAVAHKAFVISRLKEEIEELASIRFTIKAIAQEFIESGDFAPYQKERFKGFIREARTAFRKLTTKKLDHMLR